MRAGEEHEAPPLHPERLPVLYLGSADMARCRGGRAVQNVSKYSAISQAVWSSAWAWSATSARFIIAR